jgi:UrcA family protein
VKPYSVGFILLAMSVSALADSGAKAVIESTRAIVRVGDLDLDSRDGKQEARDRIHEAARSLCNRYRNSSRVDDRETTADCVRDAEVRALERLGRATVNQMAVARP